MRNFFSSILLFVLIVGLFFAFTSVVALGLPVGTSPCGPQDRPVQVNSPVILNVNEIEGAELYRWEINGAFEVFTSVHYTEPIKQFEIGVHSWTVVGQDTQDTVRKDMSNVSDVCYIEVTYVCPTGNICIRNPLQSDKLTDIINNVLTILFNFALVLTPIMVVVAGIMFVTAGGSPDRISTAKRILLWTAVGFVIILLARGLVAVIRGIIGF